MYVSGRVALLEVPDWLGAPHRLLGGLPER